MLTVLGRELVYAVTMPGLILLSLLDERWPRVAARWDDFWDEVADVRATRHR